MIQSYRCKDFAITERENYTGNHVARVQFLCVLCAFALTLFHRKDAKNAKLYPPVADRKTIYHLVDVK
jgi:hypothetical protein